MNFSSVLFRRAHQSVTNFSGLRVGIDDHCANKILCVFWQASKEKPKQIKWYLAKDTLQSIFVILWFHLVYRRTKTKCILVFVISLKDAKMVYLEAKRKGRN